MDLDLLFENALVVDGTGAPARLGDVGVRDGRIVAGDVAARSTARERIDARGLALAPGFIDIHSHTDFWPFVDPLAESKAFDGVTLELSGNCGFSAVPLDPTTREREGRRLARFGVRPEWEDHDGYRRRVEASGTAIHRALLVGHGNLRASVMGYEDRAPTALELDRMKGVLGDLLDQGAVGFSTGLIYPPGCFSATPEIIELARVVAARGRLYASHIRGEGQNLLPAIDEVLTVAVEAGVRTQVSHLKASGSTHWWKIDAAIERIESVRARGYEVMADRYPYTATNTGLDQLLRSWAYEGGPDAQLARLQDPTARRRMLEEMRADHPPGHLDGVMIASTLLPGGAAIEGKTVDTVARERGRDPYETVLDILVEQDVDVGAVYFVLCEENCRKVLALPWVMVASDATAQRTSAPLIEGRPHPRAYGTFSRVLGRYARDERLLGLEEAVAKMTSMPARQMGLAERGVVRDGAVADLVLFDPERITDRATYQDPHRRSEGVRWLVVAGRPVIRDGEITGDRPGRVLGAGEARCPASSA